MSGLSEKQRIEKACEDEAFQAALQRYAHANGSSMAIMHAAARALANHDEATALTTALSAVAKMKDLAAEFYAKEFPLSGGDVARALAEAGLLTRDEFIALVEKHDPDVAAVLRAGPPQAEPGDFDEDSRIPF